MEATNQNLYLISTALFICFFFSFLFLASLLQKNKIRKTYGTRNIALMSLLIALSVVLTNVFSYSFVIFAGTIRLGLGNFLIFIIGMIFGPFPGMIAGFITDLLGTIINSGGAYHFGFALAKTLFGFAGGLALVFRTNRFLVVKIVTLFVSFFLVYSFVISPISMASIINSLTFGKLLTIQKLIRTPIELAIYLPILLTSFAVVIQLLQRKVKTKNNYLWIFKNGNIKLKKKTSLLKKQKYKNSKVEPNPIFQNLEKNLH